MHFLLPQGFAGEVFLCGAAFKPLLKKGLSVHDVDLWVRTVKDRAMLCRALLERGATRLPDAVHPHALKFRLEGHLIEVTCNGVEGGSLSDVVQAYELAILSMGIHYKNGEIVDTCVSDECWDAVWHRKVKVSSAYICYLAMFKPPCLIRTLHRMGQEAAELGFDVDGDEEHRLWGIYWQDYSEEERKLAMDLYFETTVSHKTQHHYHVVRRATICLVKPAQQTAAAAQAALVTSPASTVLPAIKSQQMRPRVA